MDKKFDIEFDRAVKEAAVAQSNVDQAMTILVAHGMGTDHWLPRLKMPKVT